MLNGLWIKFTSWWYILPSINTLSFYRSKMILDHPNCFGWLQIVLVGSKPFWSDPNHFGQVQIRLLWTNLCNLDPTKTNWTCPKRLVLIENYLDGPKSFWTHRGTGHKSNQDLENILWNWWCIRIRIQKICEPIVDNHYLMLF